MIRTSCGCGALLFCMWLLSAQDRHITVASPLKNDDNVFLPVKQTTSLEATSSADVQKSIDLYRNIIENVLKLSKSPPPNGLALRFYAAFLETLKRESQSVRNLDSGKSGVDLLISVLPNEERVNSASLFRQKRSWYPRLSIPDISRISSDQMDVVEHDLRSSGSIIVSRAKRQEREGTDKGEMTTTGGSGEEEDETAIIEGPSNTESYEEEAPMAVDKPAEPQTTSATAGSSQRQLAENTAAQDVKETGNDDEERSTTTTSRTSLTVIIVAVTISLAVVVTLVSVGILLVYKRRPNWKPKPETNSQKDSATSFAVPGETAKLPLDAISTVTATSPLLPAPEDSKTTSEDGKGSNINKEQNGNYNGNEKVESNNHSVFGDAYNEKSKLSDV